MKLPITTSFKKTRSARLPSSLSTGLSAIALSVACAAVPAFAADAPVVGNAQAAKSKLSMCIGCHGIPGYRASFPEIYSVPLIGGQNAKYLQAALRAYATGERTHPTMDAIAMSLSEQDMADLAAYYSTYSTKK